MGNKAWKDEERRVAALFGQRRRPLSGNRQAGIGLSDTMALDGREAELFIEVKSWSRMPLIKHIRKAEEDAKGKPVILAIHSKGSKKRYAVVGMEFLAALYRLAPCECHEYCNCTRDCAYEGGCKRIMSKFVCTRCEKLGFAKER